MAHLLANMIWIGPRLGALHAACIRSFLNQGYEVVLYGYERPVDLPAGARFADAGELIPAAEVETMAKRLRIQFIADFLRYELLALGRGLYVDTDVVCIRPHPDSDHVFGWEDGRQVNNAVLKLPADSPVVSALCGIRHERAHIPGWEDWRLRLYHRARAMLGFPVGIDKLRFGTTGPRALTWELGQAGLLGRAEPVEVFYPIHYTRTAPLVQEGLTLAELVSPRTTLLHLCSRSPGLKDAAIPDRSPLGEVLRA